jgi:hypothetical protein
MLRMWIRVRAYDWFHTSLVWQIELIRDLGANKPAARAHAAGELARIGPSAAPAVPEFIRVLGDESRAVRGA